MSILSPRQALPSKGDAQCPGTGAPGWPTLDRHPTIRASSVTGEVIGSLRSLFDLLISIQAVACIQ